MTVADSQTARLLGQGRRLEHFTIGWNVLEAGVSVWAGIVAGSTALIGFGLDSAHIATTETPFPEKVWWRCSVRCGATVYVAVLRGEGAELA